MAKRIIAVSGLDGCGCGPRSLGQTEIRMTTLAWVAVIAIGGYIFWQTVRTGAKRRS